MAEHAKRSVLLVLDDPSVADAIAKLLSASYSLDVLIAWASGEAETAVDKRPLDALTVTVGLSNAEGLKLVSRIRRHGFERGMIVVRCVTIAALVSDAIVAEAKAYGPKCGLGTRLAIIIDKRYSDSCLNVVRQCSAIADTVSLPTLTPQQTRVLEGLASGCSYEKIAQRTGTTINTVRTHIRAIYEQLRVTNRAQAVDFAWRIGLLGKS